MYASYLLPLLSYSASEQGAWFWRFKNIHYYYIIVCLHESHCFVSDLFIAIELNLYIYHIWM